MTNQDKHTPADVDDGSVDVLGLVSQERLGEGHRTSVVDVHDLVLDLLLCVHCQTANAKSSTDDGNIDG